ncbi:hypothetical protein [Sporolactobacillus terrae]|uniref:hypothetical protein n=1 Tax=Sporolactobacillus terrae TaxID=269673 RepID=UPI00111B0A8E|nr:hypothetical protein [Sporolactobacillus terrae]
MAKKFASIKIPLTSPGGINLRRIIRLFEVLKKSRCRAYFSESGSTFPIKSLPQTMAYLSSIHKKELLLVLEGEEARVLHQRLLEEIQLAEENARENPGRYRNS